MFTRIEKCLLAVVIVAGLLVSGGDARAITPIPAQGNIREFPSSDFKTNSDFMISFKVKMRNGALFSRNITARNGVLYSAYVDQNEPRAGIQILARNSNGQEFNIKLSGPHEVLRAGDYVDAKYFPGDGTKPGFFFADGTDITECDQPIATFNVKSISTDIAGRIISGQIDFSRYCDASSVYITGSIHIGPEVESCTSEIEASDGALAICAKKLVLAEQNAELAQSDLNELRRSVEKIRSDKAKSDALAEYLSKQARECEISLGKIIEAQNTNKKLEQGLANADKRLKVIAADREAKKGLLNKLCGALGDPLNYYEGLRKEVCTPDNLK